jgi:4-hydroxy-3-methylbut-2-enyl diphosphate reductase IspH
LIIWKDVYVIIRHKIIHIKKIGGRLYKSFIDDFGDIPVDNFNEQTNKSEKVLNTRGLSYAARNRLKYRKSKYLKNKYKEV